MMIARRCGTSPEASTSNCAPEIFLNALESSSAANVSVGSACGDR